MLQLKVPAGTKVLLGAAVRPMPSELSSAITLLVTSIDGISEAHLPQCLIVGVMPEATQVLIVVIDPSYDKHSVLKAIGDGLARIMPTGKTLDVLPLASDNALMTNVRSAGCAIYTAQQQRPWWKFW